MGKGFYISKTLGVVGIVLGAGAVATIIALSVVYSEEKSKNGARPTDGAEATSTTPAVTTTLNATTTPATNELWDKYRLPDTLVPEHYNVLLWPRLQPNEENLYIFTGNSSVVFLCVKETDVVLIHSNKLHLSSVQLLGVNGSSPPAINSYWHQNITQYLVVQLTGKLTPGQFYQLDTVFQGELADDLGGFYRSEYFEGGIKKVIATTQMQATDARKSFPCFDEPAMKAVFKIVLIHEPGTVALSNGKENGSVDVNLEGKVWKMTTFEPTPKMSTYILAFIVCDFESLTDNSSNVAVKIWGRREPMQKGQGAYALNVTGKILKFFEDYYNAPYPLPKSDQIGLPDFNAGAMENWGLITYRETYLLYDPEMSSNSNKERIATIISHELAHMWFGNLVTLRWWNDLWLNEGFASYAEYLGADSAEPDWNVKDMIVLADIHRVFAVDALVSSHPLTSREEDINTPAQISELFDAISYSKGASVLRMLSEFLTEPIFAKGLSTYLNHFAYSNTVYTDLWDHLQQAADNSGIILPASVNNIMNRWVLQMGFPVVTINTATGEISQKHFLLDPESVVERESEFNYEWYIPITWIKPGSAVQQTWLLNKTETNPAFMTNVWLLANINVAGYYRVNYDTQNWERLLALLNTNHATIPVINRAQLLDDAFNLARAKIIDTTLALNTTKYLSSERDYIPWESALDNLDYFFLMFDRSEVYGQILAYLGKQVDPLFNHFKELTANWTEVPKGHMDQYNQVNAIRVACNTGMKECQDLTSGWYHDWMSNSSINKINANLRTTVYCSAIAAGGAAEWEFGWKMFQEAPTASEADKLRTALACTKFPWLLNRYLEYTLDPEKIRKQDATSTIVSIASNVIGQPLAWDFVRANWDFIFKGYGGGSFSFSNLINGVTRRFSTDFELKQLQQFKEDNAQIGFGSGTAALEQSIERTTANIKWLADNRVKVLQWFSSETS